MYPLYSSHAHLWPVLCPLESYESEMMEWCEIIRQELSTTSPLSVLDLGTGGAHHLYHLAHNLPQLEGGVAVDLSPEMLRSASRLLPKFQTLCQDMTTLRLGTLFPLVTVHDSFCYLTTARQVNDLFLTIATHLSPGGLAILKLEAIADSFQGPYRYLTSFDEEQIELTLTHYEWDPDPGDTTLEVIYLFLEREGEVVKTREERHRLGLFTKAFLLQAAQQQGLLGCFRELEPWDEERENLIMVLKTPNDVEGETHLGI